jgi:hypothetical protein
VRKGPHERTGTGIEMNLCVAEAQPHAARGANLAGDDKPRAAATEEEDRVQTAATWCLLA